jgi:hypothetical protein
MRSPWPLAFWPATAHGAAPWHAGVGKGNAHPVAVRRRVANGRLFISDSSPPFRTMERCMRALALGEQTDFRRGVEEVPRYEVQGGRTDYSDLSAWKREGHCRKWTQGDEPARTCIRCVRSMMRRGVRVVAVRTGRGAMQRQKAQRKQDDQRHGENALSIGSPKPHAQLPLSLSASCALRYRPYLRLSSWTIAVGRSQCRRYTRSHEELGHRQRPRTGVTSAAQHSGEEDLSCLELRDVSPSRSGSCGCSPRPS